MSNADDSPWDKLVMFFAWALVGLNFVGSLLLAPLLCLLVIGMLFSAKLLAAVGHVALLIFVLTVGGFVCLAFFGVMAQYRQRIIRLCMIAVGITIACVGGVGFLVCVAIGGFCLWSEAQTPADAPPVNWDRVLGWMEGATAQANAEREARFQQRLADCDRLFGAEVRPAALAWARARMVAFGYSSENPPPEDLELLAVDAAYRKLSTTRLDRDFGVDWDRLLQEKAAAAAAAPPVGVAPLEEIERAAEPPSDTPCRPRWGLMAVASFICAALCGLIFFGGWSICRAYS